MGKTDRGKIHLLTIKINIFQQWETKKTNIKATPFLLPFPILSFIPSPPICLIPFPEWCLGSRGKVLQSVCRGFSLPVFSPHTFLLLQHGLSVGRSSFRNIHLLQHGILHRLQCGYLLWYGPLHKLQGNACSTMVSSKGCRGIASLP